MRPVTHQDLDALLELSTMTGFGLSTLPTDPEYLEERIEDSIQGFQRIAKKPRGESYLFVLEDTEQNRVIGTSSIVSKVGGFEPFYAYRIESQPLKSEILHVDKTIQILHLVTEYNGPTEIGSLFLHPDYQRTGLGQILVRTRFLFMAEFPQHFEPHVIAELRGVVDDKGVSPFWEALGRHFFTVDYPKADHLSMKNKQFIAELMPTHPIYIPLLPKEAQSVIGQVHPHTRPALKRLHKEGFSHINQVDIFEAGPVMGCHRDQIATIQKSQRARIAEITSTAPEGPRSILSTTRRTFYACYGNVTETPSGDIQVSRTVARLLDVETGDTLRYVKLDL